MTIVDLFNDIRDKNLKPLYVLTGEETGVIDIYLNKMREIGNLIVADNLSSVYDDIFGRTLIPSGNGYIIRNDSDFAKSSKALDVLKTLNENTKKTVVLVYTTLKKNTAFYKGLSPYQIEFERLTGEQIAKHVKGTDAKVVNNLATLFDNDFLKVKAEAENITTLAEIRNISHLDAYDEYYDYLAFQENYDIMQAVDAFASKDFEEVAYHFNIMKQEGVSILGYLTLLHNTYKALLGVIDNKGLSNIEQATGTPYWLAKNVSKYVAGYNYTITKVIAIIKLIRFVEVGIKQGIVSEDISYDYLLTMGVNAIGK